MENQPVFPRFRPLASRTQTRCIIHLNRSLAAFLGFSSIFLLLDWLHCHCLKMYFIYVGQLAMVASVVQGHGHEGNARKTEKCYMLADSGRKKNCFGG